MITLPPLFRDLLRLVTRTLPPVIARPELLRSGPVSPFGSDTFDSGHFHHGNGGRDRLRWESQWQDVKKTQPAWGRFWP